MFEQFFKFEPVNCSWRYVKGAHHAQQNFKVNGIKSISKVLECQYSNFTVLHSRFDILRNMDQDSSSAMSGSKAELQRIQKQVCDQEVQELIVDKKFENFGEEWENGNETVIIEGFKSLFKKA